MEAHAFNPSILSIDREYLSSRLNWFIEFLPEQPGLGRKSYLENKIKTNKQISKKQPSTWKKYHKGGIMLYNLKNKDLRGSRKRPEVFYYESCDMTSHEKRTETGLLP